VELLPKDFLSQQISLQKSFNIIRMAQEETPISCIIPLTNFN
jgi:hypothetical protein